MLAVEPEIIDRYVRTGQVKLVFRAVLNYGERSERTSEAAYCAGQQGQFWQMHELLFQNQDQVYAASGQELVDLMLEFTSGLEGLDQESFQTCLEERSTLEAIKAIDQEQRSRGIFYQPVFELGEQRLAGFQDFSAMSAAIEAELQAARE